MPASSSMLPFPFEKILAGLGPGAQEAFDGSGRSAHLDVDRGAVLMLANLSVEVSRMFMPNFLWRSAHGRADRRHLDRVAGQSLSCTDSSPI
jgi:hypothetical protein